MTSVLIVLGQIVKFDVTFPTLAFSSLGDCITVKSLLFLSPVRGVIELFWIKLTAVREVQMTQRRKFSSNFRTECRVDARTVKHSVELVCKY